MRERSRGGRTLRAQKIVKKCPSCPTDICDFLQNPQINREMMDLIESLQRKAVEEGDIKATADGSNDAEESGDGGSDEENDDALENEEDDSSLNEEENNGAEDNKTGCMNVDCPVVKIVAESKEVAQKRKGDVEKGKDGKKMKTSAVVVDIAFEDNAVGGTPVKQQQIRKGSEKVDKEEGGEQAQKKKHKGDGGRMMEISAVAVEESGEVDGKAKGSPVVSSPRRVTRSSGKADVVSSPRRFMGSSVKASGEADGGHDATRTRRSSRADGGC